MNITIFEDSRWDRLLPLVYTRPVCDLLLGQESLRARVNRVMRGEAPLALYTRKEIATSTAIRSGLLVNETIPVNTLFINGRALCREMPVTAEENSSWVGLCSGQIACVQAEPSLAAQLTSEDFLDEEKLNAAVEGLPTREIGDCLQLLDYPWDFVLTNEDALLEDWKRTKARNQGQVDDGCHLLYEGNIHVGQGARVMANSVLDAEAGPVVIAEGVTVMPQSYIQGPCFIGEKTLIQPGTVIRRGTSIGPVCKVGGEVECTIIQGYSNKQHHGIFGHSYIGEWVNIGAGCSNSDLKNTYGNVRSPINGKEIDTGQTFVGADIGDHSKVGVNCAIPTGAAIGFSSNVVGPQSPKFVPSFTWHTPDNTVPYDAEKALAVAEKVMARRDRSMMKAEKSLFMEVPAMAGELEG